MKRGGKAVPETEIRNEVAAKIKEGGKPLDATLETLESTGWKQRMP